MTPPLLPRGWAASGTGLSPEAERKGIGWGWFALEAGEPAPSHHARGLNPVPLRWVLAVKNALGFNPEPLVASGFLNYTARKT